MAPNEHDSQWANVSRVNVSPNKSQNEQMSHNEQVSQWANVSWVNVSPNKSQNEQMSHNELVSQWANVSWVYASPYKFHNEQISHNESISHWASLTTCTFHNEQIPHNKHNVKESHNEQISQWVSATMSEWETDRPVVTRCCQRWCHDHTGDRGSGGDHSPCTAPPPTVVLPVEPSLPPPPFSPLTVGSRTGQGLGRDNSQWDNVNNLGFMQDKTFASHTVIGGC